jgi:hypothetical protein
MKKICVKITLPVFLLFIPLFLPGQNGQWLQEGPLNPVNKTLFSSCVYEGKIYVFGGYNKHDTISVNYGSQSVQVFDPKTNTWDTSKSDMPNERAHTSVELVNNKMYLIGGTSGLPFVLRYRSIEIYDPKTDSWEANPIPMLSQRFACGTVSTGGKIYLIGGHDNNNKGISLVEVYDTKKGLWQRLADMPTARGRLTTTYLDGKIYAFGGYSSDYEANSPISYIEIYDIATNRWSSAPVGFEKGFYSHSAIAYNDMIVLAGGVIRYDNPPTYNNKIIAYEPSSETFFELDTIPFGTSTIQMHLYGDEILFMGTRGSALPPLNGSTNSNINWRYLPAKKPIIAVSTELRQNALRMQDAIHFRTSFINPHDWSFMALLSVKNKAGDIVQTIELYDDGNHDDYLEADGVYGNWINDLTDEGIFSIDVITADNNGNKYFTTTNAGRPFTTIEAPKVQAKASLDYILEQSVHSDKAYFCFSLLNMAEHCLVKNISVEIFTTDPTVSILSKQLEFGDILPGEVKKCRTPGSLRLLSERHPGEPIKLLISIASDGDALWNDILIIE